MLKKEHEQYLKVLLLEEEKKEKITSTTFYDLTSINEKIEDKVQEVLITENKRQTLCNQICNLLKLPMNTGFKTLINFIDLENKEELEKFNNELIKTLEKIQFLNETNAAIILDNLKLINYTLKMVTGEQEEDIEYGDSMIGKYKPRPVIISTTV